MFLLHQLPARGLFEAEYQVACCSFFFSLPTLSLTIYAELNRKCCEAAFSLFSEQAKRLHLLCLGRSSTSQVPATWLMTVLLDLPVPHLGLDSHICNRMGNFLYPVRELPSLISVSRLPLQSMEKHGHLQGANLAIERFHLVKIYGALTLQEELTVHTLSVAGSVISGASNLFPTFSCMS